MDDVRIWGAALCCVAAATAILQFLAPQNRLGRLLELIGAAVFLCCALSPLVTVDWRAVMLWELPLSSEVKNEMLQEQLLDRLNEPLQQAVQEAGEAALLPYGLQAEKIRAITDIDENGGIYISKIVAELTEEQAVRRMAVMQILEQRFNVDVEIKEEGS